MAQVVQFQLRVSTAVIMKLIKLGYLDPMRARDHDAIKAALARLESDLCDREIILPTDMSAPAVNGYLLLAESSRQ